MCEGDKACGPCSERQSTSSIVVLKQTAGQELAIWGPMSVELPSDTNHLIRLAAVERALPGLLRVGRFSVLHNDIAVGELVPLLQVDPARLPDDHHVREMVAEVSGKYGGLPTAILPVTQAIAEVYPRLKGLIGQPVAFCGGTIFEHDRIGQATREDALAGRLDSFSITGVNFRTRPITYCDPTGCKKVEEVLDLDLSMVTLCSQTKGQRSAFGAAKAANNGAAFIVVQQTEGAMTTGTAGASNATYGGGSACTCSKDKTEPKCGHCAKKVQEASTGLVLDKDKNPVRSEASMTVAPTPVQQAEAPKDPAQKTEDKKVEVADSEQEQVEQRQRLEAVEQDVAQLKGTQPVAPSPMTQPPAAEGEKKEAGEAPPFAEKKDGDGDGKPGKEEKADDEKEEDEETKKKVQQAAPTVLAPELLAAIAQAVSTQVAEALKTLTPIKQAEKPAHSTETPTPAQKVEQAVRVETPEPAQPKFAVAKGHDAKLKKLAQAIDNGEPGALREMLEFLDSPASPLPST